MKLAFVIFKFFPYGGLQLDFRRILEECIRRGHEITVYTRQWDGPLPECANVKIIAVSGFSNHAKALSFEKKVLYILNNDQPDLIVGFNRMAGLDVYFAADNCFATESEATAGLKRLFTARYRVYRKMEQTVFSVDSDTAIMYLTQRQKNDFINVYGTQPERFHLLPPGIEEKRKPPENQEQIASIRNTIRAEFKTTADEFLLIQVCSGFETKGVDRTLRLIASLPTEIPVKLIIAGRDNSRRFIKLSRKLNISERVVFTGGRDDIGNLLLGADLMIHPARKECTGTVLIEALTAGLPIICSQICGYENIVAQAGGIVMPEPFELISWNKVIIELLLNMKKLQNIGQKARDYSVNADFYRRAEVATDIIENSVKDKLNNRHNLNMK